MPLHVSFTDRGQRERSSLRERQGYDAEPKLNLERKDLAAVHEQVKLVRDSSGSVGLILLRPHKTLGGIEIVALISGGAAGIYHIIFKCAHVHIQTLKYNLLYCKYPHT